MKSPESEPEMFCLRCGYVLDFLPRGQCPECGTAFDAGDPATYRRGPKRGASVAALVAAYVLPALPGILFWIVIGAGKWHRSGNWPPLAARVYASIVSIGGPIAWLPLNRYLLLLGPVLLAGWIVLVIYTSLRRVPIGVHALLASLWHLSGCCRFGLSV